MNHAAHFVVTYPTFSITCDCRWSFLLWKSLVQAGWTCLFYAVFHNEVSITGFLLESGANPEHCDKKGMMAIDWGEYLNFGNVCALFERFKGRLT